MHSLDLYFDRLPENYIPYRRFIYNHSDDVFFISEQGRQYFNALHKPQNAVKGMLNRLGVISNTDKLPQPGAKLVLLSNAWIQPLKRVDLIAGALALITDIQIEWIHIGDDYGMQRFDALKNTTKDLLGTKQNITYEFVGRKTQQEVYRIFEERKVNLFINVSTTEGIPVSIMEALSFGVPVIATRVGGVPEIIEDGYNGFLLDKDLTAQDVANAIKNYVNLVTTEKERLMQNAKTTWQQKYNAEKNSGELVARLLKAEA
jgi:colanic acid/amylovoran biosynthesis glycosyltransferase